MAFNYRGCQIIVICDIIGAFTVQYSKMSKLNEQIELSNKLKLHVDGKLHTLFFFIRVNILTTLVNENVVKGIQNKKKTKQKKITNMLPAMKADVLQILQVKQKHFTLLKIKEKL